MLVMRRSFLGCAAGVGMLAAMPAIGASASPKLTVGAKDCLLVIDVQRCFTQGGTLAVPKGDEVVPLINQISKGFKNVVLTQDWHTPGHASFASSHKGKKPFETTKM